MRRVHGVLVATLAVGLTAVVACGSNNNHTGNNAPPPTQAASAPAATIAATLTASTSSAASATTATSSPAAAAAFQCVSGSITAVGSTALQPLVQAAAQQYQQKCPGAQINVQGGGSGTGLSQVLGGGANIGDSDIFAAEGSGIDAKALVDHQVVKQGFVQVVNPGVTGVKSLTQQQSIAIWTGKTKNWRAVGGPNLPIVLILRPASSGTRATFKRIVLDGQDEAAGQALTEDSNGAVTQAVQSTPGAISVIGFSYLANAGNAVTPLQYNGVDSSVANMVNETYTIFSYGHMYTKGQPSGLTAAFLAFMVSGDVQNGPVKDLGYAPQPATPATAPTPVPSH